MKTHTIYRNPFSQDFGKHPYLISAKGVQEKEGRIEVTMQQHKNRCGLFVGSKDVMYYREFRAVDNNSFTHIERCEDWFENIALSWEDVTILSLEARDFKRVDA